MTRAGGAAPIVELSGVLVDRIAAGEVVERPASVVKELVENALDAGAGAISVALEGGGVTRIEVADDGIGMAAADLALAVRRHCTSKLPDGDLGRITTLGFRGEALPSIGAAARLSIVSRPRAPAPAPDSASASDMGGAARITVEGGRVSAPRACSGPPGTLVLVEDLFFATPARRKFLKSARLEAEHAETAVRHLAAAHPEIAFRLAIDGRVALERPAESRERRIASLLGADAAGGMIEIAHARDALTLEGHALGPATSRATTAGQFLVVNGRPVADPVLRTAIRVGCREVIERGRHACLALFLEVPADAVDVNVHPAKSELRFADPAAVRALVIGGLRRALAVPIAHGAPARPIGAPARAASAFVRRPPSRQAGFAEATAGFAEATARVLPSPAAAFPAAASATAASATSGAPHETGRDVARPLGAPVAQILDTYVLSVTEAGALVIVDQHAAHERLTHERLLAARRGETVRAQGLLLPEIVELPRAAVARLAEAAAALAGLGLELEPFGPDAILVRAMPAPLAAAAAAPLVADIADELAAHDISTALETALDAVLARMACHGSIRAGRRLDVAEMQALLRAMEATPRAATCSHGRPTVLSLSRTDLERMFGRIAGSRGG